MRARFLTVRKKKLEIRSQNALCDVGLDQKFKYKPMVLNILTDG